MCKILGIIDIENQQNAKTFTEKSIPIVTKTDNHGLGIMTLGENGIFAERWAILPAVNRTYSPPLLKYQSAFNRSHDQRGIPSRNIQAIAVHGRYATCEKNLQNTHPFCDENMGTALIHNGVIQNHNQLKKVYSTCDSEVILHQYIENSVKENPLEFQKVADKLEGYYASIVFNKSGDVSIFRDNQASLFIAHIKGVGIVFSTTKEIIQKTAKITKFKIRGLEEMEPSTFIHWTKDKAPLIFKFKPNNNRSLYQSSYIQERNLAQQNWNEQERIQSICEKKALVDVDSLNTDEPGELDFYSDVHTKNMGE